jgi:hypothetical protein
MADSQLYSRLLLSKGAGYPLWLPEPYDDLPLEYKERGVSVGDVGVITNDVRILSLSVYKRLNLHL